MRVLFRLLSLLLGKNVLPPEESQQLINQQLQLSNKVHALEELIKKKEAQLQERIVSLESKRQQEADNCKQINDQLRHRFETLQARYTTLSEQADAVSLRNLEENNALLNQLNWLSGTIAHDFRAPLRAIDANCFFLEGELPDDTSDETKKLLGEIQRNGKRMGVLIDGLLEYLRVGITPLSAKPLDIVELIGELISADFHLPNYPIQLTGATELPIIGDQGLLIRMFKELLDNSVKFSRLASAPNISVDIHASGVIRVTDNGVGFKQAHSGKLMQLFHRLHGNDEFEGEGIGLCIAQRIAQRHGGNVALDRVGEKTIATVTLSLTPVATLGSLAEQA